MKIDIRDARPSDAEFLAWTVMAGMGADWDDLSMAVPMCLPEDSIYSWRHARIAVTEDGSPAGCLISYPGEIYASLRDRTWGLFLRDAEKGCSGLKPLQPDAVPASEPETYPGEYYLYSLAVRPECRRRGIARLLVEDGIAKGRALGFGRITLLAATSSPRLIAYYSGLGFEPEGRMTFFGEDYTRMVWRGV